MCNEAGLGGRWTKATLVLVLAVASGSAGCREAPDEKGSTPATVSHASGAVVDLDGLKQAIAGYKGKVVYVDFWATWCVPCVKGLPELSKMQDKYGGRGLQVLAVSFDEADRWTGKAIPTLEKAGWKGPSLIMRDKAAREAAIAWLAKNWKGELPARYIFDREGERIHEFLGGDEGHSRVEKPIEELLGVAGGA